MNRIKQAIIVCHELADIHRASRGRLRDYPNFAFILIFGSGLIGSFVPKVKITGGMLFGGITYLIIYGILELKDKLASRSFLPVRELDEEFRTELENYILKLEKECPEKED